MDMRGQHKEERLEMPTTLVYNNHLPNRDNSSSSTLGQKIDQPDAQTHTIVFTDPPSHHLYPSPNQVQFQQPNRPRRDPDLITSSPIAATTIITSTPIVNLPRTAIGATISTTTAPLIRYRECLKNHAASIGGHVVDGCGEFMPNGEEGTPESLICAACTCHRNFHRKEVKGEPQQVFNYHSYYSNKSNGQNRIHSHSHLQLNTPHSSLHQHHRLSSHGVTTTTPSAGLIQPMMMAFGGSGGGPAESSSEDLNMFQSNDGCQLSVQPPLSKKRFRTKFTQEQKDKMMEFAEKLGWKIQKQDEQELQQFCSHIGLKKKVFKVWMHNSKQAMKKKQM